MVTYNKEISVCYINNMQFINAWLDETFSLKLYPDVFNKISYFAVIVGTTQLGNLLETLFLE